jgi:hypothetical protein
MTASDAESTISILGDRGQGKTTLLHFVCARLIANNSDLILPIARPDRFAGNDTLTGWVLASLREILEAEYPSFLESKQDFGLVRTTLRERLEQLRQQEAVISRDFGEGLAHQNLSLGEFAKDASDLSSAGATFGRKWDQFVTKLLRVLPLASANRRPPLLIIPVDDADLRPDLLPSIFRDLRLLSVSSSVISIYCGSRQSTRAAFLLNQLQRESGGANLEKLLALKLVSIDAIIDGARRQLVKVLPSQYSVSLEELTVTERLRFCPVGESESIDRLLSRVRVSGIPFVSSALELVDFTARLRLPPETSRFVPSPYANCLSPVPRDLSQLHQTLKRILSNSEETQRQGTQALRVLLDHAFAHSSTYVPGELDGVIRWVRLPHKLGIELDFKKLIFGKAVGTGGLLSKRTVGQWSVRTSVRHLRKFFAAYSKDVEDENPKTTEESGGLLSEAFSSFLYLAYELADADSAFEMLGIEGRFSRAGGRSWNHLLEVSVDSEGTDDMFWLVPSWDSPYDYFLYAEIWNRLVDARAAVPNTGKDSEIRLEFFLLKHLDAICRIQEARSISSAFWPKWYNKPRSSFAGRYWRRQSIALRQSLFLSFQKLYQRGCGNRITTRDRDFAYWFENLLPFAADELCCTPQLSEWILSVRERIIEKYGDLRAANTSAADLLADRVRENLSKPWVDSTIQLITTFSPTKAKQLKADRDLEKARTGEQFKDFVQKLAEAGIPDGLIRRVKAFGLTEDTADALSAAGLPSDFLLRHRSLFRRQAKTEEVHDEPPRWPTKGRG